MEERGCWTASAGTAGLSEDTNVLDWVQWLIKGRQWWLREALAVSCPPLAFLQGDRTLVEAVVLELLPLYQCKGNGPDLL